MTNEPIKALHYSEGKSGVDQIPPFALLELGKIYKYGEKKYGRDNWKNGTEWHEFYGSLLRHIYAFGDGQDKDLCDDGEGCAGASEAYCPKHSRLPHLAHALWNVITLMYYQRHGLGKDFRTPQPEEPQYYIEHPDGTKVFLDSAWKGTYG